MRKRVDVVFFVTVVAFFLVIAAANARHLPEHKQAHSTRSDHDSQAYRQMHDRELPQIPFNGTCPDGSRLTVISATGSGMGHEIKCLSAAHSQTHSDQAGNGSQVDHQGQAPSSDICLDGFDLTAIVIMENDIRHAVQSYACQREVAGDNLTYPLYQKLRGKWVRERQQQGKRRDVVYQRIYGNQWQQTVMAWQQQTAVAFSENFKPDLNICQQLRLEIMAHTDQWQNAYNAAAAEAASARYDPLRCGPVAVQ